jgi:putative transposase
LFKKPEDYAAFGRVLVEARARVPLRIVEWCLMPNHWHFVVWPREDGEVSAFFRWLAHTHAMRAIRHRRVMGMGPLYQGRFKSLAVESDEHVATLLRYVLWNPVRAKLARGACDWRWSGMHARRTNDAMREILSDWPIEMPRDVVRWLAVPPAEGEIERLREHVRRSRPYGSQAWTRGIVSRLGLEWTIRPQGGQRRGEESNGRPSQRTDV